MGRPRGTWCADAGTGAWGQPSEHFSNTRVCELLVGALPCPSPWHRGETCVSSPLPRREKSSVPRCDLSPGPEPDACMGSICSSQS